MEDAMSAPRSDGDVSPRDTASSSTSLTAHEQVPKSPSRTSLHQLQQLLPTCQRCRRLRRKCDTQLPNCGPCHRAGSECTIFDHALKQTLPRAYVQLLLTRVEHLEAAKAGGSASTARPTNPSSEPMPTAVLMATEAATPSSAVTLPPPQASPGHVGHLRFSIASSASPPGTTTCTTSYDVIVPSTVTGGKSRYWGASSVFALSVEILQHATERMYVPLEDVVEGNGSVPVDMMERHEQQATLPGDNPSATEADIRMLLQLYFDSSNTLYGFVDPDQTNADLEIYLALRQQRRQAAASAGIGLGTPSPGGYPHGGGVSSPGTALGDHAHPYFRIAMMCAIACATRARYRPHRTSESLAYYADALAYVEEVTAEVSPSSLQALLLLIVFCLFFPRKGDVWKLLDYACRLALELGYHTEPENSEDKAAAATENNAYGGYSGYSGYNGCSQGPAAAGTDTGSSGESEPQKKLRRSTFWGLYAIERIVGQLFGRGSDLPESIITVAYPSSLVSAAATTPGVDRTALQAMSIAHHYRLVYLRSEIFRSLYLPARPLQEQSLADGQGLMGWLRQQYNTLFAWRQELDVPDGDQREGVATVTCDVGYDATMCFLFQPLLLRALRETSEAASSPSSSSQPQPTVASEPFYSSIHLIRTYEKVIRAPEASPLGSYPMTFLSAHYIYLATSTLLAYALLRLDGRTAILGRMSDEPADDGEQPTTRSDHELDWGAYIDVSSSCLLLLAWCGERWPGLLGVLGIYQRLFTRTIRELINKGVVR